jgi:hypothetical protein
MGFAAVTAAGVALLLAGLAFGGGAAVGAKKPKVKGTKVTAALTPKQEVPRQTYAVPRAYGRFNGVISKVSATYKLQWSLSFHKLSGTPMAAHIHIGRPGSNGKIVVLLCQAKTIKPCGLATGGLLKLTPALVRALTHRDAYVNVHTRRNPNGEIRGTIVVTK